MIFFGEFFDPGNNANVTYRMGLNKEKNLFLINILPIIDAIYKTSDHKTILYPEPNILLELNFDEIIKLLSGLIKASSDYFNIEHNRYKYKDLNKQMIDLTNCKYNIMIRIISNPKVREKFILDIYDKNSMHIISTKITKTKIFFLIKWIKFALEKSDIKKFSIKCVDINKYNYFVTKNESFIGVNDIWIRNKEIQDLRAFIDQLIFNHKFASKGVENSFVYRQVGCFFDDAIKKVVIAFKHFKKDEKVVFFELNPITVAVFFMALPEHLEFTGDKRKRENYEI